MSTYKRGGREDFEVLRGITAELKGFLELQGDDILNYALNPKGGYENIKSEGKGRFVAGIIEDLDNSRDTYSTTSWRGTASELEEGVEFRAKIEYSSVVERSDLPPRSAFLDQCENDPHDLLTEPLEVMIRGEIDMSYENIDAII